MRQTRHEFMPLFTNVNMDSGALSNHWVDSLQAALITVLVLNGNLEAAAVQHALHFSIWQRYGAMPERFNWHLKVRCLLPRPAAARTCPPPPQHTHTHCGGPFRRRAPPYSACCTPDRIGS